VFATGQSVRPGQGRGRTTFRRPVPSFPELARQARAKDQDGRHRPPPSPAVFRCFPMLSAVCRRPPPSPAVLCSYLPSPGRSCLRSWGSSSLLMTAVLGIKGRGRTTFCRPVSSGGLGSPPAGPYGGPGRLRTLLTTPPPPNPAPQESGVRPSWSRDSGLPFSRSRRRFAAPSIPYWAAQERGVRPYLVSLLLGLAPAFSRSSLIMLSHALIEAHISGVRPRMSGLSTSLSLVEIPLYFLCAFYTTTVYSIT